MAPAPGPRPAVPRHALPLPVTADASSETLQFPTLPVITHSPLPTPPPPMDFDSCNTAPVFMHPPTLLPQVAGPVVLGNNGDL